MKPRRLLLSLGMLAVAVAALLFFLSWRSLRSTSQSKPAVVPPAQDEPLRGRLPAGASPQPVTVGAAWAEIDTPPENGSVPRTFGVAGRCGSLPAGTHLMLVVQTGRVLSPKMPPVAVNGENWSGACHEYGVHPGGSFTLCAFLVSNEGLDEIAQWHAQGKATGKYPPFRVVPGGVLLAKAKLRLSGEDQ